MNLIDLIVNEIQKNTVRKEKDNESDNISNDVTIVEKTENKELIMEKKSITISQLAKELVEGDERFKELGITKTQELIQAVFELIQKHVANGDRVSITRFGKFEPRFQQGRQGINNVTKKPYKTEDKYVPKFEASDKFKELVAQSLKP